MSKIFLGISGKEKLKLKLKSYKEEKIHSNENKEEEKINENEELNEEEKKDLEKEEKLVNEIKKLGTFKFQLEDEHANKSLSVKEFVKKGENIELYVHIPQTFEEETIKISSVVRIESTSMKKLELEINIISTTIPTYIMFNFL